jgi:nucleoid DNA-binding protein
MSEPTQTVTRREFVTRFMRDVGVTYEQACRIYECMCNVIEDGIVSGSKVRVGRVGALTPVWRRPREVQMHFAVRKGKRVVPAKKTFVMDGRYVYKFKLYRQFVDTHALRWFAEADGDGAENV